MDEYGDWLSGDDSYLGYWDEQPVDSNYSNDSGWADYTDQGLEDMGDGYWYDPSDGSIYDDATGEWTFDSSADNGADTVATDATAADYADWGLQDNGDGTWYDPSDGSTYDPNTNQWTFEDGTTSGGEDFQTDGDITTYADGSQYDSATGEYTWPDGSWLDDFGNYGEPDGSVMWANGDYTDANGVLWESLADAGAPNVLINSETGDAWNIKDGTIVPATFVDGSTGATDKISYDEFLAQQKVDDPANYARLTQPTARPSSGGSGGGSGASGSFSGGGGAAGGAPKPAQSGSGTMADIGNLIKAVGTTTAAIKQASNSGAPQSQIAQLQSQLAQQAKQLTAARQAQTGVTSGSGSLGAMLQGNTPILIAVGVAALFLMQQGNRSTPSNENRAA